jgi:DNA-binding NarL/FixJ family response regulator
MTKTGRSGSAPPYDFSSEASGFRTRSVGVQSVRSADSAHGRPAIAQEVAVVSHDDLITRRVRDSLSRDAIAVGERAADVVGLSERAAEACAIVLAGGTATSEQRELIRAAEARFPGVPTVVVGASSTNGVHKALDAGASGVVLDSEIEWALAAAIRAVCAGQAVVPRRFRRQATRPALSHREKQTLALVATGLTNRQIAGRLFLAESTVKTHLTSIFSKLDVGSRSEAAALVLDPEQKLGLCVSGLWPAVSTENGAREHSS